MKKYIAMVLSLAMVLGVMVIPAGAAKSSTPPSVPDVITVISNGHGQYSAIPPSNGSNNQNPPTDMLTAYATKDSDLFYVSGDTYLAQVTDNTYLMVQRIPLSTESADANTAIFEKYQLDNDIQDDIANTIEEQRAIGNHDFEIDLFTPSVQRSVTYPNDNYYTYNGNNMLDKFVKYSKLSVSTGELTGTSVRNTMSKFKNLLLSAGGIAIPSVALFGVADSALAFYQSIEGVTVSRGTSADKTYTNISYDKLVKKTFYGVGGSYLLGCTSTKVWLETNATYQYYHATGKHNYKDEYLNQTRYTPSYNNAAYVALHNTSSPHDDGSMKVVVRGVTCYF